MERQILFWKTMELFLVGNGSRCLVPSSRNIIETAKTVHDLIRSLTSEDSGTIFVFEFISEFMSNQAAWCLKRVSSFSFDSLTNISLLEIIFANQVGFRTTCRLYFLIVSMYDVCSSRGRTQVLRHRRDSHDQGLQYADIFQPAAFIHNSKVVSERFRHEMLKLGGSVPCFQTTKTRPHFSANNSAQIPYI